MRPHLHSFPLGLLGGLAAALAIGCGGGNDKAPPVAATERQVFYKNDDLAMGTAAGAAEVPYPPLDQAARGGLPEYIGVAILGGTVHLSRPKNWTIRRTSSARERRFIEYDSPNAYIFAIYERTDSPVDSWRDVMDRYEDDAKSAGAELVAGRVPMATGNAQGRAYAMRRKIRGQKAPYTTFTREVLLRSEHRIDLVEIAHQGESLVGIGDEMLRVMETLELL